MTGSIPYNQRPYELGLYTFVDNGKNALTGTTKRPKEVMANLIETIELVIKLD